MSRPVFWLLIGAFLFCLINGESDDYIKQVQEEEDTDKNEGEQIVYQNPTEETTETFHKYFLPPVTGEYKFYAKCGSDCDVILGDESKLSEEKIISVDGSAAAKREFPAETASHIIYLKQGQKYLLKTTTNSPAGPTPMIGVQLPDDTKMMPIKQSLFFSEQGTAEVKAKSIPAKNGTDMINKTPDSITGKKHLLGLGSSKPKTSIKHKLENNPSKTLFKKLERAGQFIKSMEDKKLKNDKLDSGITDIIKTLQENLNDAESKSRSSSLLEVAGIDRSHIDEGVSSKERIIIQLIDALKRNLIMEDKHRKMKEHMYQRKLDRLFHEVNKLKSVLGNTNIAAKADLSKVDTKKNKYTPQRSKPSMIGQKRHHKHITRRQHRHHRLRKPELNFVDEIEDPSLIDDGHAEARNNDDGEDSEYPMSVRKITPSAAAAYEKAINLIPESEDDELMEQGLAKASAPESDMSAIRHKQAHFEMLNLKKKPTQSLKSVKPIHGKEFNTGKQQNPDSSEQQMMNSGDQTNPQESLFVGKSGKPSTSNQNLSPEYDSGKQQGIVEHFNSAELNQRMNNQNSGRLESQTEDQIKNLATTSSENKIDNSQSSNIQNIEPEKGKAINSAQNNVQPELQNPVEVSIGGNQKENLQNDNQIGQIENEVKINPNDMKKSNDHFETDKPFYRLAKEERPLSPMTSNVGDAFPTVSENQRAAHTSGNFITNGNKIVPNTKSKQSVVNFKSEDIKALEDNLFAAFEKRLKNKGLSTTLESLQKNRNRDTANIRDFEKTEKTVNQLNTEKSPAFDVNVGKELETQKDEQILSVNSGLLKSIKDTQELVKAPASTRNTMNGLNDQHIVLDSKATESATLNIQQNNAAPGASKVTDDLSATGRELINNQHANGQFMGDTERPRYIKKYQNLLQPEESVDIFSRKGVLKYKKPELDEEDRHYWQTRKKGELNSDSEGRGRSVEEKQDSPGFVRSNEENNQERGHSHPPEEKNHKYVYFRDDKIYIKDPTMFLRKPANDMPMDREESEGLRHHQDEDEEKDFTNQNDQESQEMRGDARSTTMKMRYRDGAPTAKFIKNQNEALTSLGMANKAEPRSKNNPTAKFTTSQNKDLTSLGMISGSDRSSMVNEARTKNMVEEAASKHEMIQTNQDAIDKIPIQSPDIQNLKVTTTNQMTDQEEAAVNSVEKMSSSINAMNDLKNDVFGSKEADGQDLQNDVFGSKEGDGQYLIRIRNLLGEITFLKEEISSMKRDNVYTIKDKEKMEMELQQKQNLLNKLQTKRKEIARPAANMKHSKAFKRSFKKLARNHKLKKRRYHRHLF